jgi:hypothetical protein
MKWVTIGAVVVALGAGGFLGYGWYAKHQEEASAKPGPAGNNSGGSDQTGTNRSAALSQPRSGVGKPGPAADAGGDAAKPAGKELPVIPAVWTLDIATAKIPESAPTENLRHKLCR